MNLLRLLFIFIAMGFALPTSAYADLVIFHNGDYRYGDVVRDASGNITITFPNGDSEKFHKRQVRYVHDGVQKPAMGEVVSVSEFVQAATAEIYEVTGNITHSKTMKNPDGKEFQVDVQNDYEIPVMRFFPTRYSFFNRPGAYLVLKLQNTTQETHQSLTFRVFVYDQQDQLVATKDFLVHRLPPTTPEGRGGRVVEIDIPDVRYEQINRIRVVRRY